MTTNTGDKHCLADYEHPPGGHAANGWKVTRRDFLKSSGLVVAGLMAGPGTGMLAGKDSNLRLRFGMAADVHFADTPSRGERHYRESLSKMRECTRFMNERNVEFLIELGDFKDEGEPALEKDTLKYLKTIEKAFREYGGPRYHVLGNHDMDSISKEQFQSHIRNTGIPGASTYYSFNAGGIHLVVLDANYRADGSAYDHGNYDWKDANLPEEELDWLGKDLASTGLPVIVFVHQLLDGEDDHSVRNARETRRILEESGKVLAVFQGHKHGGQYSRIGSIHYYTLKAMVTGSGEENSSYAVVEVREDHTIGVTGYRRAETLRMEAGSV